MTSATLATALAEPSTEDVRVLRRQLGPGRRIRFAFWIGPALLLAVWVAGSATGFISAQVLTAPWAVVREFGDQWSNHDLLGNIATSVRRAAYGLVLGTAIGAALIKSFGPDQALTGFALPWVRLIVVLIAGVLVGLLAAILPARRAARLDPLDALATE